MASLPEHFNRVDEFLSPMLKGASCGGIRCSLGRKEASLGETSHNRLLSELLIVAQMSLTSPVKAVINTAEYVVRVMHRWHRRLYREVVPTAVHPRVVIGSRYNLPRASLATFNTFRLKKAS